MAIVQSIFPRKLWGLSIVICTLCKGLPEDLSLPWFFHSSPIPRWSEQWSRQVSICVATVPPQAWTEPQKGPNLDFREEKLEDLKISWKKIGRNRYKSLVFGIAVTLFLKISLMNWVPASTLSALDWTPELPTSEGSAFQPWSWVVTSVPTTSWAFQNTGVCWSGPQNPWLVGGLEHDF